MSHQLMKPVQRSEDFVLPDVAAFAPPVLRALDEIGNHQPDIRIDRAGHADHDYLGRAQRESLPLFLSKVSLSTATAVSQEISNPT